MHPDDIKKLAEEWASHTLVPSYREWVLDHTKQAWINELTSAVDHIIAVLAVLETMQESTRQLADIFFENACKLTKNEILQFNAVN